MWFRSVKRSLFINIVSYQPPIAVLFLWLVYNCILMLTSKNSLVTSTIEPPMSTFHLESLRQDWTIDSESGSFSLPLSPYEWYAFDLFH
jgi:hypothetical protein